MEAVEVPAEAKEVLARRDLVLGKVAVRRRRRRRRHHHPRAPGPPGPVVAHLPPRTLQGHTAMAVVQCQQSHLDLSQEERLAEAHVGPSTAIGMRLYICSHPIFNELVVSAYMEVGIRAYRAEVWLAEASHSSFGLSPLAVLAVPRISTITR